MKELSEAQRLRQANDAARRMVERRERTRRRIADVCKRVPFPPEDDAGRAALEEE